MKLLNGWLDRFFDVDMAILKESNPFENSVVRDPWDDVVDVSEINREVSNGILEAIDSVKKMGKSKLLLILGDAGIGKTHLLARIRRLSKKNNFYFSYIEPISSTEDIFSHILKNVITSLEKDNSLNTFLSTLMKKALPKISQNIPLRELIGKYGPSNLADKIIHYVFMNYGRLPRTDFLRVLFHLRHSPTMVYAIKWIMGDELNEEELKTLGVRDTLRDESMAMESLKTLALLLDKPLCLCFDQIEAIYHRFGIEGLSKFLSILMELFNWVSNLCIVIMCQRQIWIDLTNSGELDAAFITRLKESKPLFMRTLSKEESIKLVATRMKLIWKKYKLSPPYPSYPFTPEFIEEVAGEVGWIPRDLIQRFKEFIDILKKKGKIKEIRKREEIEEAEVVEVNIVDIVNEYLGNIEKELSESLSVKEAGNIADQVKNGLFDLLSLISQEKEPLDGLKIYHVERSKKISPTKTAIDALIIIIDSKGKQHKIGVDINWKAGASLSKNIERLQGWIPTNIDYGIIIRIGPIAKSIQNKLPKLKKIKILHVANIKDTAKLVTISKIFNKASSGELTDKRGGIIAVDNNDFRKTVIEYGKKDKLISKLTDLLTELCKAKTQNKKQEETLIIDEGWLEKLLCKHPELIEKGLNVIEKQKKISASSIDILAKDPNNKYVLIELKKDTANKKALDQILEYMNQFSREYKVNIQELRGIIVCEKATSNLRREATKYPNIKIIERIQEKMKTLKL